MDKNFSNKERSLNLNQFKRWFCIAKLIVYLLSHAVSVRISFNFPLSLDISFRTLSRIWSITPLYVYHKRLSSWISQTFNSAITNCRGSKMLYQNLLSLERLHVCIPLMNKIISYPFCLSLRIGTPKPCIASPRQKRVLCIFSYSVIFNEGTPFYIQQV